MVWPRLALAASLPVLLPVVATAGEADTAVPAETAVPVLWVEATSVPGAVRDAMVREAADVLGPLGVRLVWRTGPPETESEPTRCASFPWGRPRPVQRPDEFLGPRAPGTAPE